MYEQIQKPHRWSAEEDALLKLCCQRGMHKDEIAHKIGRTTSAVLHRIARLDYSAFWCIHKTAVAHSPRSKTRYPNEGREWDTEALQHLRQLCISGYSNTQIAALLGRSASSVQNRISVMGFVSLRPYEAARAPRSSLCWDCKRSFGSAANQCCWAKAFVPVHGWSAQRTKLKFHRENTEKSNLKSNYVESYIVYACPQFVSDKKAVLHYNHST